MCRIKWSLHIYCFHRESSSSCRFLYFFSRSFLHTDHYRAFLCLILLSIPLPSTLKRMIVKLMDAILFRRCKACGMKFTLYKWCVLLSLMSFVISWIDTEFNFSGTQVVVGSARRGVPIRRMKNHQHALILAQDEKEWWVSLFTLTMYLVLDRFRKSVKHDLGMYNKEKMKWFCLCACVVCGVYVCLYFWKLVNTRITRNVCVIILLTPLTSLCDTTLLLTNLLPR